MCDAHLFQNGAHEIFIDHAGKLQMNRYPTIHLEQPCHQRVQPGLKELWCLAVQHVQAGEENEVGFEVVEVGKESLQHGHFRVGGVVAADEASCYWRLRCSPFLPHLGETRIKEYTNLTLSQCLNWLQPAHSNQTTLSVNADS